MNREEKKNFQDIALEKLVAEDSMKKSRLKKWLESQGDSHPGRTLAKIETSGKVDFKEDKLTPPLGTLFGLIGGISGGSLYGNVVGETVMKSPEEIMGNPWYEPAFEVTLSATDKAITGGIITAGTAIGTLIGYLFRDSPTLIPNDEKLNLRKYKQK